MDNPLLNHRTEIDQALFFAIARADYDTALSLLQTTNANPNAIFQVEKAAFVSSFNLFISKTAALGQAKGHSNAQYLSAMKLMKELIKRSSLECKCLKEHKCPLYIAL
jgi:3-methyladenine DNA glycosylase AlkD